MWAQYWPWKTPGLGKDWDTPDCKLLRGKHAWAELKHGTIAGFDFTLSVIFFFFFPFRNWVVAVPVTVLNKVTAVFSLLPHIHTELWFLFIPYFKKIFLNTIQVKYFLILKASGFTKWVSVSFASESSLNLSIINLNRKHLPYYLSHLGIFKCCLIGPEELHLDLALDTTFSVISCYRLW